MSELLEHLSEFAASERRARPRENQSVAGRAFEYFENWRRMLERTPHDLLLSAACRLERHKRDGAFTDFGDHRAYALLHALNELHYHL